MQVDVKHTSQPVALAYHQAYHKVVVGLGGGSRQNRQGGQLALQQVYKRSCQRVKVELSLQLSIGKVALYGKEVDAIRMTCCDVQVIQTVGRMLLGSRDVEVTQSDVTLRIVQVACSQISLQLSTQRGAAPLVGQMQGVRVVSLYVCLQLNAVKRLVVQVLVGQLSCNLRLQVGVVNIKVTGYHTLVVAAVKRQVMIGIALVVEIADNAIHIHVGFLPLVQLTLQGEGSG